MQLKTKALLLEKSSDPDSRTFTFTASSDSIDADGDIVEQDFVLERFKANPVILWAHQSRELPIGKATNIGMVDGKLKADIEFASAEANPKAEQVHQLVKEGVLNAVSIGFIPKDVRREMRDEKEVFVLSKNELYEISVTPIPSNPDALADAKAKAIEDFKATADRDGRAASRGQEKSMNEKEFNELQAKAARLESELEDANGKLEALQKRYDATEKLYTEEKAVAAGLRAEASRKRVEELVGKKIAPTEVDSLVKLAALDSDLFEKHMAAIDARPDQPHVKGSGLPTGTDEGAPTIKDVVKDTGETSEFSDLVNEAAGIQ